MKKKVTIIGFTFKNKNLTLLTDKGDATLVLGDFERLLTMAPYDPRYQKALAQLAVFCILRQPDATKIVNSLVVASRMRLKR